MKKLRRLRRLPEYRETTGIGIKKVLELFYHVCRAINKTIGKQAGDYELDYQPGKGYLVIEHDINRKKYPLGTFRRNKIDMYISLHMILRCLEVNQ
jgi:hypothetical protein